MIRKLSRPPGRGNLLPRLCQRARGRRSARRGNLRGGPFFSLSALSLALPLLLFHREENRFLQRERKTLNKSTGPAEAPPVLPLAPRGPLCGAGRLFPQRSFFVFVAPAPTPAAAPFLHGGALRPPERSLQAPRGPGRALESTNLEQGERKGGNVFQRNATPARAKSNAASLTAAAAASRAALAAAARTSASAASRLDLI